MATQVRHRGSDDLVRQLSESPYAWHEKRDLDSANAPKTPTLLPGRGAAVVLLVGDAGKADIVTAVARVYDQLALAGRHSAAIALIGDDGTAMWDAAVECVRRQLGSNLSIELFSAKMVVLPERQQNWRAAFPAADARGDGA